MSLSKKERTIKAYKKLISLYRDPPKGHAFCNRVVCPLCAIHDPGCKGCPNRRLNRSNCDSSLSPTLGQVVHFRGRPSHLDRADAIEQIIEIIEILKDIPSSRFTVKGWRYFKEIKGL